MARCKCLDKCPFFNGQMAQLLPAAVDSMKLKYCLGNHVNCARYIVFTALSKEDVPSNLAPNDTATAKQILRKAGIDKK